MAAPSAALPDQSGHFGRYGGRYVPEILVAPLDQLEAAYNEAQADEGFRAELDDLSRRFAGRPTPLYHTKRLSEHLGGAEIYLKREDLLHTGVALVVRKPVHAETFSDAKHLPNLQVAKLLTFLR